MHSSGSVNTAINCRVPWTDGSCWILERSKAWQSLCLVFIHNVLCCMRGPWPLPKGVLLCVPSRSFSFSSQHSLVLLISYSSCLHILPRLPVTYIRPSISLSITCFWRQFLRNMWPIQLAFLYLVACRIYLSSLPLLNTSSFSTQSAQMIFSILLQQRISNFPSCFWCTYRNMQVSAPQKATLHM
jgi:hypothetical protein